MDTNSGGMIAELRAGCAYEAGAAKEKASDKSECADNAFLLDVTREVEKAVLHSSSYSFPKDMQQRMETLNLSGKTLATRLKADKKTVSQWINGKSFPKGREKLKELGMALAMDADELDRFLKKNAYPGLYVKNPLDNLAEIVLMENGNNPDTVVKRYRDEMKAISEEMKDLERNRTLAPEEVIPTQHMMESFYRAVESHSVTEWRERYISQFLANEQQQIPVLLLQRFISLHLEIAVTNVTEMKEFAGLPNALEDLMSNIHAHAPTHTRPLREKLIALGFSLNMAEQEIDFMLSCTKCNLFTESVSALDYALKSILSNAHKLYPVLAKEHYDGMTYKLRRPEDDFQREILAFYRENESAFNARANAFHCAKGSMEEWFMRTYTGFDGASSLMDFARDVLTALVGRGCLTEKDTEPIMGYLTRNAVKRKDSPVQAV